MAGYAIFDPGAIIAGVKANPPPMQLSIQRSFSIYIRGTDFIYIAAIY